MESLALPYHLRLRRHLHNVSVGDTCKEIGVTRHDSDDAVTEQKHNAEFLLKLVTG
jgi:hypothetical protein